MRSPRREYSPLALGSFGIITQRPVAFISISPTREIGAAEWMGPYENLWVSLQVHQILSYLWLAGAIMVSQ